MLQVDDLHALYWEESGNPRGVPVVHVHGGPGAGVSPQERQWFDPAFYRTVLHDQRAAFRWTPPGEIRNKLVTGGAWGTTLALAYGQSYPHACLGYILRGIVLENEKRREHTLRAPGDG